MPQTKRVRVMHIGKSVEIALIKKGMKKKDLAKALGVSAVTVSSLVNSHSCKGQMLEKLCDVLDMKASDLIALGE